MAVNACGYASKGYGWMLKATAEAHEQEVFDFAIERRDIMLRTALRYTIEKMPLEKRKLAMSKEQVVPFEPLCHTIKRKPKKRLIVSKS